jgi:hypothetical protein
MDYRNLTPEELLNLWHSNRNSSYALMAADELLNRIYKGEFVLVSAETLKEMKK